MKSILKKIVLITIIGFVGMICISFCSLVLYPKVVFEFHYLGENPPSAIDCRLLMGAKYPQVFKILFGQAGNSFNKDFLPDIFVNKPYKTLHIKEMSYTWQEGEGVFLKDKKFEIPGYHSTNDWYLATGLGKPLHTVNFEKIFKTKEPGDTFWFTLKIVFSFDDEPEQTQILRYNVVTIKNWYNPIFYF